jgi:hypothetical protein
MQHDRNVAKTKSNKLSIDLTKTIDIRHFTYDKDMHGLDFLPTFRIWSLHLTFLRDKYLFFRGRFYVFRGGVGGGGKSGGP